ncbi:MAG TPA: hypothetical protein VJB37_00895 [Patescibacteria group bacterium]|nr:hypothetical protein [Patescibacteria group bacterium]
MKKKDFSSIKEEKIKKAWVVAVDMGYGHQRAVFPLRHLAQDGLLNANHYAGIPNTDRRKWEGGRTFYETISRLKHLPLVGERIFSLMDYFQRIDPFYPARDLSRPGAQLTQIFGLIHRGWGRDLIEKLNRRDLPLITSFFTPAYFAQEHGFRNDIYLLCCDADISRTWAPLFPQKSRINYLVPNRRVKERLQQYGVRTEKIYITGFPLPKENLGKNLEVLKRSLGERVVHLDPEGRYRRKYQPVLSNFLSHQYCHRCAGRHPLTITFAVGGAGAQRELGAQILTALREPIARGKMRLNLVAGVRNDVYLYYQSVVRDLKLNKKRNGHVNIIYAENKLEYFAKFNQILLNTDILWTKPSELSFYAGLGLPIIMAPTIGSQEEFNKAWLTSIGAGVPQEDPRYTAEWLADWLSSGWLAEAAMKGFLDAPHNGVAHIEDVVLKKKRSEIEDMHLL